MKRIRSEHKAKSGSMRDTLKALLDTSNRAEARISKAREVGGGDGSNRTIGNIQSLHSHDKNDIPAGSIPQPFITTNSLFLSLPSMI